MTITNHRLLAGQFILGLDESAQQRLAHKLGITPTTTDGTAMALIELLEGALERNQPNNNATTTRQPLAPGSIQPGDYIRTTCGSVYLVTATRDNGKTIDYGGWSHDLRDLVWTSVEHMNRLGKSWLPCHQES